MAEDVSREKAASEEAAPESELVPSVNGYRITELQVSNVLRLVALDVTPPEDYVELVGKNGNGKTSTLRSIEAALRGAKAFSPEIVHRGKREAKISASFHAGDFIEEGDEILSSFKIVRRISPKGGMKLELTRPDGTPIPRPQEFLDKLIGLITFDPLEFLRDKKKRVQAMLEITNLEEPLETIALQRKELFDRRSLVSRSVRDKEGALKEIPIPKNAPDFEVDTAQLVAKRRLAQKELDDRIEEDVKLEGLTEIERLSKEAAKRAEDNIRRIKEDLAAAEDVLAIRQTEFGAACQATAAQRGEILKLEKKVFFELAVQDIDGKLSDAGDQNKRFADAKTYREKAKELDDARTEKDKLTDGIAQLDAEKIQLFEDADYPVEGMRFGEDDLTLNGHPFEQISDALRLRVSMEIATATNPNVRIILLRRANDLDDDALAYVKDFAKRKRFQIWAEKIHDSGAPAIIVEDGESVGGTAVSK